MEKTDFIQAGFSPVIADPQIKYESSLNNPKHSDDSLMLVYADTGINSGFAIVDILGNMWFFSADSPQNAIAWASKITSFEPNF